MISMELQRDVPQYMAIPWLMTWVMARTVSVTREGETTGGGGRPGAWGLAWGHSANTGRRQEEGEGAVGTACKQCTSRLRSWGRPGFSGTTEKSASVQEAGLENNVPK